MKKFFLVLFLSLVILTSVFARPTVALVLSGGGAKGLRQIPVIQELERRGIYPDIVAGTSMGGLLGALYAAGYSGDEMYEFVLSQNLEEAVINFEETFPEGQLDNYEYNVISTGLGGLNAAISDSKINSMIRKAVVKTAGIDDFDELSIPFRTLGTDFSTELGVVFDSGSLYDAMRSTMSIPVIFPPYILEDGTYVIDGGMVDNFPVALVKAEGADIVIGVDVNDRPEADGKTKQDLDTLDGVFDRFISMTSQSSADSGYDDVDFLLVPDITEISTIDFSDVEGILRQGQKFVDENQELFDEIEEALAPYGPFEKPSPSYAERGYITITKLEYPASLSAYRAALAAFEGRAYDEAFIDEFDALIEDIVHSLNLKQINYYVSVDGVMTIVPKEYASTPFTLSVGLTRGFFDTIGSGYNNYGFDQQLSLALQNRGKQTCSIGVIAGRQSRIHLGIDVSAFPHWHWESFVEGGHGGYSVISSPYLKNHIDGNDWTASLGTGLSYRPDKANTLSLYARFEYYFLGNDSTYGGGEITLWEKRHVLLPYVSLSYKYDGEFTRFEHSFGGEARAGWRDGFIWSLDLIYAMMCRLSKRNAIGLEATVFSSRVPYELLSSYRQAWHSLVSRDYISAGLVYNFEFLNKPSLNLTLGAYFVAHDGNASAPVAGDGTQLVPGNDSSLVPFSDPSEYTLGLKAELSCNTAIGTVGVFASGLISGVFSFGVSIK